MKSTRRILAAWKKNAAWQEDGEEKTWMLLDFQRVIPVPCGDTRVSVPSSFAVLDAADKLDAVVFGMSQELKDELM